jgi:HopA1 effector protein family
MTNYLTMMGAAVAAVQVHSATSYSWFGQRNPALPKAIQAVIGQEAAREYLLHGLHRQLYHHLYCTGAAVPARNPEVGGQRSSMCSAFIADLSAANAGSGSREAGWRVHAIDQERIVVERHGLHLWMEADQLCLGNDPHPEVGMPVSIRLPNELLKRSPGYYVALGNEEMEPRDIDPVIRLYWNLIADAAPQLMTMATTRLNAARIPFRLKVINDPERYARCDAAVLYAPKRCYPRVAEIVAAIHRELAAWLMAGTPAFTKPLAPGLALAEDPGTGDSFGMHRCRLFAEAITNAYDEGRRSVEARLESVIASFASAGVSCEQPFLNPGSADTYPVIVDDKPATVVAG